MLEYTAMENKISLQPVGRGNGVFLLNCATSAVAMSLGMMCFGDMQYIEASCGIRVV